MTYSHTASCTRRGKFLLLGCTPAAVLGLVAVAPAAAQVASEDQPGPEMTVAATTQAVAPGSAATDARRLSGQLEEITVTARRRSESLQKTPVSVVALSTEALELRSVTNLRSLQSYVPNLTFAASQNVGEAAGNAFIRGIGQEDFVAGSEPGIGFYLDGVYFARTSGTLMNLTDVERVEVLRGPQGTLFGKNTIGGAINVVSVMPQATPEGHVSVLLGNFDRVEFKGVLNYPLTEAVLARLSVSSVDRDGYGTRLAPPNVLAAGTQVDRGKEGDDHSQAARLQLRWLAGDTLTADLSIDGSRKRNHQGVNHIDELNPNAGLFPIINSLIAQGALPGPAITNDLMPKDQLESYAGGYNFVDQDFWGTSLTVTQDVGKNTLKFIGAYRGLRNRVGTDPDGLYFDIVPNEFRENQEQYSGELQWNATAGLLTYTAGIFAFREEVESLPTPVVFGQVLYTCGCYYVTPPTFTTSQYELSSDSYAAYAQSTFNITDKLSTTLGARYSQESKSIDGQRILLDANLQPTGIVTGSGANDDDWGSFTYRAGLEYQATEDLMLYGSAAKGYKSGGFNVRMVPNLPNLGLTSFKPETALTYEIGIRSEWLDRRLRVNATVFHSDYEDIQLRQQTILDGITTTLIGNAAKARIRGAEVELVAALSDSLTLTASYGHLDPEYLEVGTAPDITLDSEFQRAPSDTANAAVDYEFPLLNGTMQLHGDYSYRSKEQLQLIATPWDQEAYGLVGARVTFRPQSVRWSLALFGTNLTDERYRAAGRGTLINQVGFAYSSIGMPRQYGVQVRTDF